MKHIQIFTPVLPALLLGACITFNQGRIEYLELDPDITEYDGDIEAGHKACQKGLAPLYSNVDSSFRQKFPDHKGYRNFSLVLKPEGLKNCFVIDGEAVQ